MLTRQQMLHLLHAMGERIDADVITTLLRYSRMRVACQAVYRIIEDGPDVWPDFNFRAVFQHAFQWGCSDMLTLLAHAVLPPGGGTTALTLDPEVVVRTVSKFTFRRSCAQVETTLTGQLAFVARHCCDVLSHPSVVAAAPAWLARATAFGYTQAVQHLLEPGWSTAVCVVVAEAKAVDQVSLTSAMHCACHAGDADMVQHLLRHMIGCPAFGGEVPLTGCTCHTQSPGAVLDQVASCTRKGVHASPAGVSCPVLFCLSVVCLACSVCRVLSVCPVLFGLSGMSCLSCLPDTPHRLFPGRWAAFVNESGTSHGHPLWLAANAGSIRVVELILDTVAAHLGAPAVEYLVHKPCTVLRPHNFTSVPVTTMPVHAAFGCVCGEAVCGEPCVGAQTTPVTPPPPPPPPPTN